MAARLGVAVVRDRCCGRFHRGTPRSQGGDLCASPIAAVPGESRHPRPAAAFLASAPRCRTRAKWPFARIRLRDLSHGRGSSTTGILQRSRPAWPGSDSARYTPSRATPPAHPLDTNSSEPATNGRSSARERSDNGRNRNERGRGHEKMSRRSGAPRADVGDCSSAAHCVLRTSLVASLMWTGRRGWRGHAGPPLHHPWRLPAPG